jgi:RNA polymerase sigma-70 factor (ECF subfamily)
LAARDSSNEQAPSAAAAKHDEAAFWIIADRYRPYLKSVADRLLGGRLPGKVDASDLVQQALLAACERLDQLHGEQPEQWLAWLAAIVRNKALHTLRYWGREVRDVRIEESLIAESDRGPLAPDDGSAELAARRERAARLLEALGRLSADHRRVLELRHFDDLSFTEIAARMDRQAEAVRQLWVRAVRRLREELGDEP